MKRTTILFIIAFFLYSMNTYTQKEEVDFIVANATIYTVDNDFSKIESFAVKNGKITGTGTTQDILNQNS